MVIFNSYVTNYQRVMHFHKPTPSHHHLLVIAIPRHGRFVAARVATTLPAAGYLHRLISTWIFSANAFGWSVTFLISPGRKRGNFAEKG